MADLTGRFDRDQTVAMAQRIRAAQDSGAFRDHQPAGPVGAPGGSQQLPQVRRSIEDHLAQARRNLSLQRPGSDAQAETQAFIDALLADTEGGFSANEPRLTPRDQRTVAFDPDEYRALDDQWNERHTVGTTEPQPMNLTIRDLQRALGDGRTAKTLRRWEREGVIPPARRSASGTRVYSEAQVTALARCAEASGVIRTVHPTPEQLADFSDRAWEVWERLD